MFNYKINIIKYFDTLILYNSYEYNVRVFDKSGLHCLLRMVLYTELVTDTN